MSNKSQQAHEEDPVSIKFIINCSEMYFSSKLCFEEKQSILAFIVQIHVISFPSYVKTV